MSRDTLPVILVSARDATAAATIITDLIDNERGAYEGKDDKNEVDNVWRLENKYYTVDVRLVPVTDAQDDAQPPHFDDDRVEAHIIYLTEDECVDGGEGSSAQAAAARARVAGPAHVRLALAAAPPPAALRAWASRAGYELVALGAGPGDGETHGTARAREALHAHPWRGLRRAGPAGAGPGPGPGPGPGAARDAVERAEGFAAALGALGSAAAATRALDGAARLDAAEDLVAAFCRALGLEPDAC